MSGRKVSAAPVKVARAIAAGYRRFMPIQNWTHLQPKDVKHGLRVLREAGKISSTGGRQHEEAVYDLLVPLSEIEEIYEMRSKAHTIDALLEAWPAPVKGPSSDRVLCAHTHVVSFRD